MDMSKLKLKSWLYENLDNYELNDSIFFKFKNIDKYRIRVPKFLSDHILNKFIYDNEKKMDIGGLKPFSININLDVDESEFINVIEKCLIKTELLTKKVENIKEEILDYYINLDLIDPNIEVKISHYFKNVYSTHFTSSRLQYMTSINDEIIIYIGIIGSGSNIDKTVENINNKVNKNKNVESLYYDNIKDNLIEIFLKIKQ